MEQQRVSSIKYVGVDMLVGMASSFVHILIGYPLDFLKTRFQMSTKKGGAIEQLRSIIKKEGYRAFYRGVTSPLLGAMVSGSVYFSSYEFARRRFTDLTNRSTQDYLPLPYIYLSGAFAGATSDIFNIPLEYSKIQVQKVSRGKDTLVVHPGPISVLFSMIKDKGLAQIYKGSTLQLSRDMIGCGMFFTCYEWTLRQFTPEGKTRKDAPRYSVLIASIAAGFGYWSISYPIDVIKTRIQGDDIHHPRYRNISQCLQEVYSEGGIRPFYKGYWIAVSRSIIVNIVALNVYENLHRFGYSFLE